MVNVAVGGSFFTDDPNCANSPYAKPWKDSDDIQMKPFWESKNEWLPTWNADTEDNAMQVDYIRVYALGWLQKKTVLLCIKSEYKLP